MQRGHSQECQQLHLPDALSLSFLASAAYIKLWSPQTGVTGGTCVALLKAERALSNSWPALTAEEATPPLEATPPWLHPSPLAVADANGSTPGFS